jgi:putative transposase
MEQLLGQWPGAAGFPHLVARGLTSAWASRRTDDFSQYRALFRSELDAAAIDDIRLAASQSQPVGDGRFLAKIKAMLGARREPRPRGRPKAKQELTGLAEKQGTLNL